MSIIASFGSIGANARRLALALAISFGIMHSDAAVAQLAPGYSGHSDAPREGTEDQYWSVLREIGRCVARSKADGAVRFLASAVDSQEEAGAFQALFAGQSNVCMQNTVRLVAPRAHIRGAIAEGLFKARYLQTATSAVLPASGGEEEPPIRTLHDFARCYVKQDFLSARMLIVDTQLGTRGERDRVRQMAPDFSACFPEGVTLQINPPEVRMALAEALYVAVRDQMGRSVRGAD